LAIAEKIPSEHAGRLELIFEPLPEAMRKILNVGGLVPCVAARGCLELE